MPVLPPMDSRAFLRYFWKHKSHSQNNSARHIGRLPKKLGDSLVQELKIGSDELKEGWGIHILEGPNKAAICWALLIIIAASFGTALGYNLIMKVEDSGFAIGQWIIATLAVAMSALYFSLEDDANSSCD